MGSFTLDGISKQFTDTHVLKNLNLVVKDGEFLTLVGPSGCGKSTLLRIIAGLERQSRGHIKLNDNLIDQVRPSERNISMVFQSYALYPHLSVFDNIAVPLRMRWMNNWQRLPLACWFVPGVRGWEEKIKERIQEASTILGLEKLLHRKPGQLSGGQRQRVAVGRAIVRHPEAFLFDEPLSNLDAKLRMHMRTEITRLHRQLKTTFIYVTHDQAEAMTMSDRIAVMMNGELVQVGTPDEVYSNPQDIRVAEFIGSPQINILEGYVGDNGYLQLFGKSTSISLHSHRKNKIRIGMRPEHLFLSGHSSLQISGTIDMIENLGAEIFLHLSIEGHDELITLRTTPDLSCHFLIGEVINIGFDVSRALIFDEFGKRITVATPLQGVANG